MNEDRSNYLWLRIMGSLAIIACLYQVSITLLDQRGTPYIFFRQAAFSLVGLSFLLLGYNRKWIGLTAGVGVFFCILAADLVEWKNGDASLADALWPFMVGIVTLILWLGFLIKRNSRKTDKSP